MKARRIFVVAGLLLAAAAAMLAWFERPRWSVGPPAPPPPASPASRPPAPTVEPAASAVVPSSPPRAVVHATSPDGRPALRLEDVPAVPGWRRLDVLGEVAHDLRYATTENFGRRAWYDGLDTAWLREEAAAGLQQAQRWLARERPGFRLLVLDALRPQRVQEAIWQQVRGTPMQRYFTSPRRGSIHAWGMAVDVTLLGPDGRERDFGTAWDEPGPRSHPALDARHLARGLLTKAQVEERRWLAQAMRAGGFRGVAQEWWHFDFGPAEATRRRLPRVL